MTQNKDDQIAITNNYQCIERAMQQHCNRRRGALLRIEAEKASLAGRLADILREENAIVDWLIENDAEWLATRHELRDAKLEMAA